MRLIDLLTKTRLIPGTSWVDVTRAEELGGISCNGQSMADLMAEVSPKPDDEICIGMKRQTKFIAGTDERLGFLTNVSDSPSLEMVESLVDDLADEQRVDLFHKYCWHCGDKDSRCHCNNDD